MNISPSTKAWWGRFGMIIFIMGSAGLASIDPDINKTAASIAALLGSVLAINLGWSKADHR